jgi:hypothetical protein
MEMRTQIDRQSELLTVERLLSCIQIFNRAAGEARNAWQPSLPLEMALVESVEIATVDRTGENPGYEHNPGNARLLKDTNGATTPVNLNLGGGTTQGEPSADPEISSDLSLQQINASWQQVISSIAGKNPQVLNLLRSCKPYGMKAGILFLGFDNQILKSKMERGECLQVVEEALKEATGKEIPVRCFVAGQRKSLPEGVESDGMVAAALRDLGGEIVDIQ